MATGSAQPAVLLRGVTKRYGDRPALQAVDLTVAPGELRGLLGPNGAGKTTLLRILFGLIRPDGGTVELLGHRAGERRAASSAGVAGFVEEPTFYPYLSGRANLELLSALDDDPDREAVDNALGRLGMTDRAQDRVAGYSTGMRQRLGIAAALVRRPRLLLLDEPTSGLDPAGIRAVAALLRKLSDDGVAVVLSSHLIGELEALCSTHTILRDGQVVWDGDRGGLARQSPGSVHALLTSDDSSALEIAGRFAGVQASRISSGLRVSSEPDRLDGFVLALASEGVAVRRLELTSSPLEALYFTLTADSPERVL